MADGLEAARVALYRPGADAATVAAYEEAVRAAESTPPANVAPRRARRPLLVAAAIVMIAVAVAIAVPRPPGVTASHSPEVPLRAELSDRSLLPAEWRDAGLVDVRDGLDGATPLTSRGHGLILLVVRCPAEDRSYQVQITPADDRSGIVAYGACGGRSTQRFAVDATRASRVLVTTRGPSPFSAALLGR